MRRFSKASFLTWRQKIIEYSTGKGKANDHDDPHELIDILFEITPDRVDQCPDGNGKR